MVLVPDTHEAPRLPTRVLNMDVYVTFRCNLRCRHCFVGANLDTNLDLPWPALHALLDRAVEGWGTEEVTFLGGEPSLYPNLRAGLEVCAEGGIRPRIVSNGGVALRRMIERSEIPINAEIVLSFDGPTEAKHDQVRGSGSFRQAVRTAAAAVEAGYSLGAITSLGTYNQAFAEQTLEFLAGLGASRINVHHVTNRGFAAATDVPQIEEWDSVTQRVYRIAESLSSTVRHERTFFGPEHQVRCALRDADQFIVYPDGRVFQCTLLLNIDQGHSFVWADGGLEVNRNSVVPGLVRSSTPHCPAYELVNRALVADAESRGRIIGCIFNKTVA